MAKPRPLGGVMLLLVDSQVLLPCKPLSAALAGEGPLARVDALMRLQVSRLGEAFPTLGTPVRPLARVDAHVRLQAPRRCEAFAAAAADEAPIPAGLVLVQGPRPGAPQAQHRRAVPHIQAPVQQPTGDGRRALLGPRGAQVHLCVQALGGTSSGTPQEECRCWRPPSAAGVKLQAAPVPGRRRPGLRLPGGSSLRVVPH